MNQMEVEIHITPFLTDKTFDTYMMNMHEYAWWCKVTVMSTQTRVQRLRSVQISLTISSTLIHNPPKVTVAH